MAVTSDPRTLSASFFSWFLSSHSLSFSEVKWIEGADYVQAYASELNSTVGSVPKESEVKVFELLKRKNNLDCIFVTRSMKLVWNETCKSEYLSIEAIFQLNQFSWMIWGIQLF